MSQVPAATRALRVLRFLAGLAVTHLGYAATFAVAAAFPVLAAPLVPARRERRPG